MRDDRRFHIRPVGGGVGCLTMILLSIIASLVLTIVANLIIR